MKRVVMFLIVFLIIPGLVAFSGEQKKIKKGAEQTMVSGSLVQWKHIEKVDFRTSPEKRHMKAIMNFVNPKKLVKKSNVPDPVVQTGFNGRDSKVAKGTLAMPTPSISFAGMNLSANGAGWPPDPNGDVGLNYYIQVVNTSIGIYNKSTGAVVSTTTFDSFFPSAVGSPCDNYNNGDPIVHFDPYSQRWILYDFAWSGSGDGSYFSIAASQTSDPTGAWWTYCYHADNTLVNDYPKSGIWNDGIYMTANMFTFAGSFQHAKVWAFKKPDIYNGTLVVQSITDSAWEAWSILPANAKGSTAPPSGAPNYMYALDADEYGSPGIDAIYWWRFYVDWTTPANTVWDGSYAMNVAAYTLTASEVPQPGTSNTLDSLFGRLMYPANYRNFGSYASVYLNHVCDVSGVKAERWYEIRINSGTSSIYQQSSYSPDSNHRWMGSIAGDKNGNMALGYSVSSSSVYPSIRYAGRLATDTLNQLSQGEASLIAGSGSQTTYDRWGDYTSMTIDPVDDETFWYTNEYYTSTGTNWQTRIGAFKFSSTPPTPPDAPTNLTAAAPDCDQVDLTWQDNADNETGFYVERSINGTTFSQIATVGADVENYSDTTVAAQTQYWYRVKAYNSAGDSAYSNTATVTTPQCTGTPPAAPTIRSARAGRTNVRIRWRDNATDETGYRIYRGLSAGSLSLVATLPANTRYYNDTGLSRRTRYYYKVCAYNSYGEGCSAVFSVRTR
jgi:hypothetical protein